MSAIPSDVREYLKMLLHINSELRPDAGQVMKVEFWFYEANSKFSGFIILSRKRFRFLTMSLSKLSST
jgi:hypothetical protein